MSVEVELPRCIALRSQSCGSYLRYVHEHGDIYRQLQLNGKDAINPYTRYDVVQASVGHNGGLVHIRCRYNRKYWVARRRGDAWCIAADADEPEEDLTSPNCTLIKPIINVTATTDEGDESVMTVRFVGAGDEKVKFSMDDDDAAPCMHVVDGELAHDSPGETFTVVNLEKSSKLLPNQVMFKGNNGSYLASRRINNLEVLQFIVTDVGDQSAVFHLAQSANGKTTIRTDQAATSTTYCTIKNRSSAFWIENNVASNGAASFWIYQVKDAHGFVIHNVETNFFCKSLSMGNFNNCLNAADPSIMAEAIVAVEEPILHREIHSIRYILSEATVYDTTVLTMATTAAVNDTSTENTKRLKLEYAEEEMSTWDSTLEVNLGYKATIRAGFPKLGLGGQVSISAEFYGAYNWGETMEKKVRHEVVYEAAVPPRTKVTVKAVATRSTVDVPFHYRQRDVTTNGIVTDRLKTDGLFTGINSYNFNFETVEERLPERIPVT